MTTIRALSFDLDDTLWDNKPVIQHAENCMMEWLEQHAPKLTRQYDLQGLTSHKLQLLQQCPELKTQISELRRQSLRLAMIECGYSAVDSQNLAEGAFTAFIDARHQVTFFEGVEETLSNLSKSYTLIAITNGNIALQRLAISDYFSHAYNAEDLGITKPNPDIYKVALQDAAIDIAETLHIGDCPKNDITAAQQAGLRVIWFNPENKPWTGTVAPDATITKITELSSILQSF